MESLFQNLEKEIKSQSPHDTHSFLMGFLTACDWFSVWKDGQRTIGVNEFTMQEIRDVISLYIEKQK